MSPYQILVFPFYSQNNELLYAFFKRNESKVQQGIVGGGEEKETPIETATIEVYEEVDISSNSKMIQLNSTASIPVVNISGVIWGENILVIHEFSFVVLN